MKCCLSSSSTFPLMMSVTSITAKTNQGHSMNWAMWEEGTPWGIEATVTQRGMELSTVEFQNFLWNNSAVVSRLTQTLQGTGYSNNSGFIQPHSSSSTQFPWKQGTGGGEVPPRGTCHPEGSAQPRRQLPGVVVAQLHPAHAHDLTHKTDLLSLQVLAAQVLPTAVTPGCFLIAEC